MREQELKGLRVAIVATDGYEEVELVEPRKALEAAGATIEVLAPRSGEIQGFKHHDKAGRTRVDRPLAEAKPADYDAVLLPGGGLNADALRAEKSAKSFVRAMQEANKPFAVICHAPWTLVSAGLVEGRRLTSYHTIQDDLKNAGADWVDEEVVVDRNWVTSRQPDDIPAFNREMLKLFAGSRTRAGAAPR